MKQFSYTPSNQVTSLRAKWVKAMIVGLSCVNLSTLVLAAPSASEKEKSQLQLQNQLLKRSLTQSNIELAKLKDEIAAYETISSIIAAEQSAQGTEKSIAQIYTQQSKQLLQQRNKTELLQKIIEEIYQGLSQSQNLQDKELKQQYIDKSLLSLSKSLNHLHNQQSHQVQVANGFLETQIKAIDPTTGVIVLDEGSKGGMQIGMRFEIKRNEQILAQATLVDIREQVSGAFLDAAKFKITDLSVGDQAYLIRKI